MVGPAGLRLPFFALIWRIFVVFPEEDRSLPPLADALRLADHRPGGRGEVEAAGCHAGPPALIVP